MSPEGTRTSPKNPVVYESSGRYRHPATKLLWSDLQDSMILSCDLKSGVVTTLGEKVFLHNKLRPPPISMDFG